MSSYPTSAISSHSKRPFAANLGLSSMRLTFAQSLADPAGYAFAIFVTAVATGVNFLLAPYIEPTNLVMVYLLGVTWVAGRCSRGPAILASFLCVAAFNFCFVHPQGTFVVSDVQYIFTFGAMLAVSLLISTLAIRLRSQSLAQAEATAQAQLEQARGDLLSAVSHDLRTPLSSISGSAGALLSQPELSEQSRGLASTIQTESNRMADMVRNLLDMTRVSGAIELDLDWYGLDELVANAIERTQPMLNNPIRLNVAPDTPLAKVDGVLIEQVFINLLENAARHGGRDVQVDVAISKADGWLSATVSDDGPGIPSGMEARIFERFSGSKEGFGLGLAICKAAAEAHGGDIRAENLARGGARFILRLPTKEVDSG